LQIVLIRTRNARLISDDLTIRALVTVEANEDAAADDAVDDQSGHRPTTDTLRKYEQNIREYRVKVRSST